VCVCACVRVYVRACVCVVFACVRLIVSDSFMTVPAIT